MESGLWNRDQQCRGRILFSRNFVLANFFPFGILLWRIWQWLFDQQLSLQYTHLSHRPLFHDKGVISNSLSSAQQAHHLHRWHQCIQFGLGGRWDRGWWLEVASSPWVCLLRSKPPFALCISPRTRGQSSWGKWQRGKFGGIFCHKTGSWTAYWWQEDTKRTSQIPLFVEWILVFSFR